uniref:Integrase zinc-binding domain-containing protein n=1 Tax=Trichogramma kaykai TaxID=54128 RepID=A0ABD2WTU1_9HYME
MSQDIALFCKACVACQKSKITRHNEPAPAHFEAPDARFQHVHIDIVCPLKSALMCKSDMENMLQALPMVMLGLRTSTILYTDMSPAEIIYEHLKPAFLLSEMLDPDLIARENINVN